ncbi:hypothetical protein K8R43_04780 [archaeon]|nr:hypothetical protein [archaeon]
MRLKFKDACPSCFIEKGYSVEMEPREEGVFQCPQNAAHRFKRDEQGYWKKV